MLYPKSILDIAKGTLGYASDIGYSVGMSLFYRRVAMPVILIGIMIAEKEDQKDIQSEISDQNPNRPEI